MHKKIMIDGEEVSVRTNAPESELADTDMLRELRDAAYADGRTVTLQVNGKVATVEETQAMFVEFYDAFMDYVGHCENQKELIKATPETWRKGVAACMYYCLHALAATVQHQFNNHTRNDMEMLTIVLRGLVLCYIAAMEGMFGFGIKDRLELFVTFRNSLFDVVDEYMLRAAKANGREADVAQHHPFTMTDQRVHHAMQVEAFIEEFEIETQIVEEMFIKPMMGETDFLGGILKYVLLADKLYDTMELFGDMPSTTQH